MTAYNYRRNLPNAATPGGRQRDRPRPSGTSQLLLYTTADGRTKLEVVLRNETVWLSIDQMAELFRRNKSTISRHLGNIFAVGKLGEKQVVAFFATTATNGKTYSVAHYNLDIHRGGPPEGRP